MARPREFDENEVLDKAMMCFWEKGYEGASVSALEKATGISRISLYNTFKDKEHLFIAVQNKYHAIAENYLSEILGEDADIEALENFFKMIATKTEGESTMENGCMMVNTVLNVDAIGQDVVENVKKYREMMVGKFETFLKHMQGQGRIRTGVNVKQASIFLLSSMWGALAVNRLYGEPSHSQPHIHIVLENIQSWK